MTELHRYCEDIATMFGARIEWLEGNQGGYWNHGEVISVGAGGGERMVANVFCHEMGHYLNWREGKYPLMHSQTPTYQDHFKTFNQSISYSHRAEIYTDKRGAELMKMFFPRFKYKAFYQVGKSYSRGFLYGYHFGFYKGWDLAFKAQKKKNPIRFRLWG